MNNQQKQLYGEKALALAKANGASYIDIRIIDFLDEKIYSKNGHLEQYRTNTNEGFGVRVISNGAWGFCASSTVTEHELERVILKAISIAKASAIGNKKSVNLTKETPYQDTWTSSYWKDPFTVSIDIKKSLLMEVDELLRKEEDVKIAEGYMNFRKEYKTFISSEGSFINQSYILSGAGFKATAIGNNDMQERSYPMAFGGQYMKTGWELVEGLKLKENAPRIAKEASLLLKAQELSPKKRDIIISGDQLALQIHESCGHPSELDRVLGYEENYAGSSFISTDKYKNMHYGSPIVNIVADSTASNGLGSFGYDDDGVKAQRYDVVRNGLYQTYFTNREFAHNIWEDKSHGCNRAEFFSDIPIIRMINLSLLPGEYEFDEMVKGIDEGLYVEGIKTWSIDQMRINFQFTCEIGYIIKNGKMTDMVKNPTYQGITTEFWQNCDAIGNEKLWKLWGVINCGKGQPMQSMMISHGAAPSRFRNIMTGIVK